ncbi:MAG: DUF2793 domain-containing protein [bacterium]
MSNTPRLGLSYLLAAQAQKHVTVNESLRRLDAVVQLAVLSDSQLSQPLSPQESDAYILPLGKSGVDWDSFTDQAVAIFQDGAWMEIIVPDGTIAHIADLDSHKYFNAGAWQLLKAGLPEQLPRFGVNASPDATNRLSVKAEAELLSHDDVTPGSGDARKIINKANAGNTASVVFQTGYSGRAEFGLTGNDDFALKVSADGTNFTQALTIDNSNGQASFPQGLTSQGHPPIIKTDTNITFYVAADAGSAQTGDYIGLQGLKQALADIGSYIFTADAKGIIYLRDGVYTGDGPIRNNHAQPTRIELRAVTAAASIDADNDLTNNITADETALRAAYAAIIEITDGHGIDCYERTGFGYVADLLFIRTAGSSNQNGLNVAVEGIISLSNCAFHGFYNGINISSKGSVTATNGLIVTHSSSRSINTSLVGSQLTAAGTLSNPIILASSTSTGVLVNVGSDVTLNGYSFIQDAGSFGTQVVGGASLRINGSTGQAIIRNNTGRGVYCLNSSAARLSNIQFRNNGSYAVQIRRGCYGETTSLDVDPAGTTTQKTILAEDLTLIYESGTHQNSPIFSPPIGQQGNNGSWVI